MLSTTGGAEESLNYSTKGRNRVLSSSSPSNSSSLASASPSSSSPSPFSPLALRSHPIPRGTTMEEVWNDISLASLHDRPSRDDSTTNTAFRGGLTFQDFLSRPLGKNPPPPASVAAGYGSPASPPVIGLSLNSAPDRFDLLGNSDDHPFRTNSLLRAHPIANVSSLNGSFDALASSSSLLGLGKKRFTESDSHSGDRRHKRMIKNRESAARSRARKQAYTNELELEVAHLMEENARLKRQQQQLCLAAAAQVPKKNILHRTSTAPF